MARALIVKTNLILNEKTAEEMRRELIEQYNAGGIIVLDKGCECEVVEFDGMEVREGLIRFSPMEVQDETNII